MNENPSLIKKNGVYFVNAQIVHKVKGAIESCVRAGDSQISKKSCVRAGDADAPQSCVRAEDAQKLCVRAEDAQMSCARGDGLQNSQNSCLRGDGLQNSQESFVQPGDSRKSGQSRVYELKIHKTFENELKSHERHACELKIRKSCAYELKECKIRSHVVRPSVMTHSCNQLLGIQYTTAKPVPIPCEASESEKMKHELTHIPFKPWCTSFVKGKAQSEPHKRIERTIEDSELPFVQCDFFVLKDTAASGGLKSFEYVCKNRLGTAHRQL